MAKVKDIMKKNLKTISENKTVYDACALMQEYNIRAIPCTYKRKLTGIVTSTDIIYNLVLKDKSPKETKVKDIMKKKPITIAPEATDIKATYILENKGIKHLLVVKDGKLKGMFTKSDTLRYISQSLK